MQEVYKTLMLSSDEGVIRKCLRLYILISNSGVALNPVITSKEV